ncbi:MAG: ferritin family protein [Betaproteobacteria bacterium]|nr:ferritin family protein [Betaproteobacteria bacterium]
MTPPRSAAELYAHAIEIEREAAERYGEFAERMADLGNDAAAELFGRLADFEAEHLEELRRRTREVEVPKLGAGQYRWLDAAAPETAARELVFRLLTPRQALLIALAAERRAEAFFEHVMAMADDPALRALAREMAAEEQEHVALVERVLEGTPAELDWSRAGRELLPTPGG